MDEHGSLACSQVMQDKVAATATGFLLRASDWLNRRGVMVQWVMTGNGSHYVYDLFLKACQFLEARHVRTRPYTPRTNGKAEQFIQTSPKELAYKNTYETPGKGQGG